MVGAIELGYRHQRVPVDTLDHNATWRHLHPEFKRRLLAFFEGAKWDIGVGTGWRSAAEQDAERARRLRTGTGARMAPSSGSWHCADPAGAVDLVFANSTVQWWAHAQAGLYGLWFPAGDEPWHVQALGYGYGRRGNPVPPLQAFELPGSHVDLPAHVEPQAPAGSGIFDPATGQWSLWPFNRSKPYTHRGQRGDIVRYAQGVLMLKAHQPMHIDGSFGFETEHAVANLQRLMKRTPTGAIGKEEWDMIDFLAGSQ